MPKGRAPNAPVLCDATTSPVSRSCVHKIKRPPKKKSPVVPHGCVGWSFEHAASAAGTTRFASLRQFLTRAEPAGALLRGDGVSAPPHAPLFRERRSGLRRRGVPRAEGSTADRKPTDQVGALSRLFARETLAGGRCRLSKRSRRRPVPALYSSPTLAAWMMSLEQTLIFSRTGPSRTAGS